MINLIHVSKITDLIYIVLPILNVKFADLAVFLSS